ncbi:MAG: hypothetical protein P8X42_11895 [Calditrichaceae bacterium]|jgi:predicted histidine transporter YuiF (NhaC family)
MSKLNELIKSPHIHIALATGLCIIIMAYFSKRILSEPIGYLPMAIPPFIALIFESLLGKYGNSKICTIWYWILAVFLATGLVILFSWLN